MAQVRGLGPRVSAVLHSSREQGVRRPCSDFVDMLRSLINCPIIIIITIISISIVLVQQIITITARICISPPTTALDSSASQAEKAKAKIQCKIQSKYNSKVSKKININIVVTLYIELHHGHGTLFHQKSRRQQHCQHLNLN